MGWTAMSWCTRNGHKNLFNSILETPQWHDHNHDDLKKTKSLTYLSQDNSNIQNAHHTRMQSLSPKIDSIPLLQEPEIGQQSNGY